MLASLTQAVKKFILNSRIQYFRDFEPKRDHIMRNYLLSGAVFLALGLNISLAQSQLHIPKEVQQAYTKGTRSKDGRPGPNYWQNTAVYDIDVRVSPTERTIYGKESVTYVNNSPDDLTTIVVRLYYDVYKEGNIRSSSVKLDDVNEGVSFKSVSVNGMEYDLGNRKMARRTGTNLFLNLFEPLKSGESLTLGCEWSQLIPVTNRRTGVYDSTTFFVGYFYPQIAVYDDVFGWDDLDYTLRTEFYNGLADFDVKISAPAEFSVWATGVLQNAKDIYPKDIYKRYKKAKSSTEVVHVITEEDLNAGYKNLDTTWHYKANKVSDFAFAMTDHYAWDAVSQKVEDRDVLIGTVFPADKSEDYKEVTTIQQKTMKHFSEDIPGIPYPYPEFTTFIGLFGGGMEYPMMANNDSNRKGVTIHELFHTYFPMYVRVNERRFAWMDEGWADFITSTVTNRYFEGKQEPIVGEFKFQVQATIGSISDIPLITSSQFMDGTNYGYSAYPLPAFIYSMLHHHLGDEMFFKAYKEYINRWKTKSPTPWDFFYTFENVTGEDLSWFWKPWFFEYGYPDVKIKSFENGKLIVENLGSKPTPLSINVQYKDDRDDLKVLEKASIWTSKETYSLQIEDYEKVKMLSVNMDIADLNELDNFTPPVTELYKELSISKDIVGTYAITQYPIKVIVKEENGLFKFSITRTGVSTYLLPKSASTFTSLDGAMNIDFTQEGEVTFKIYGIDLKGIKE